jgi:hypothetical protein
MICSWWRRRDDLDAEVQQLMGSSELTVYDDEPHSCIHIMRGDEEFTSAIYPFDDSVRDDLRQQAFLLHNGLDEAERLRIVEANKMRAAADANTVEEAKADWREYGVWEYKNRFQSPQVTPMVINPWSKT